jgi:hypothetical protein
VIIIGLFIMLLGLLTHEVLLGGLGAVVIVAALPGVWAVFKRGLLVLSLVTIRILPWVWTALVAFVRGLFRPLY